MKKIKTLLGILLALGIIIAFTNYVYAEDQVTVTRAMMGDDNTTQVVRLTKRVVNVEDGAFSGMTALKEIRVDGDNEYYASCNGCLYNKDFTVLICIPQNTKSVGIKRTVTSYLPHAVDGLDQSRIDALNNFLGASGGSGSYSPSTPIVNNPVETPIQPIENPISNPINEMPIQPTQPYNPVINNPVIEQPTVTQPIVNNPVSNNIDFSKYVYRDGNDVCFEYTGSGDSRIIIPEGVTKIIGFHSDFFSFNTDITYIYIPSSVTRIRNKNQFNQEQFGWDNNGYNCLYQCANLRTVESASPYWRVDGNGLYQPLANGGKAYSWSPNQRIKYDKSIYYSSGSVVDSNGNIVNR